MTSQRPPDVAASWSLAARLTAWYAGSAFLLILAATAFLYWALLSNLDREDDQFLADKIQILRTFLREKPRDATPLKQEAEWESAASQHAPFFVRVLDEQGAVLIETPGMSECLAVERFPPAPVHETALSPALELVAPDGKSYRLLSARANLGEGEGQKRVLQVALDRTYEEELLASYRNNLWLVLGTALLLGTLVGYRIARRGLRPVADITETARRIRSSTLDERLEIRGLPAELSALAGTFNDMLDRLEESFNRLARFSADLAHELRTPVNNLRGEAEVALGKQRSAEEYREVLSSCLEECGRLARIIDSLLFLARAESPESQICRELLDVEHELRTVRDFYEPAATEAGITLGVTCPERLQASLDRTLLQRALGNLVANALAHTPAGGTVQLGAQYAVEGIRIEVADNGSGIPAEHLPHVFDRFYRVDPARATTSGGVGLGLALVKTIAGLHGGSVALASTVGRGTRVLLTFPAPLSPSRARCGAE